MALINEEDLNIEPEKIAKDCLTELDDKYQKTVGFFAWDYFLATGHILKEVWDKIIYVAKCIINPFNMDYDDLVDFVYYRRNIVAKKETYATGLLTVTNGNGTIREGDIFETVSGVQYAATSTQTVAENGTFEVQCLTAGTVGNVSANTITVIPTTIQGIVEVTNETAFSNGYEKESKESIWQRYLDDIQKPITSNNIYHYRKWALEVTGVGDAKIKPLWADENTVKVVIVDANYTVPSADLIADVQTYIDPNSNGRGEGQSSIGCYCTVTGATAKNISITVSSLSYSSALTEEQAIENIKQSINAYFKEFVKDYFAETDSTAYISYAKIGALIINADGVNDYEGLLVNGDTENITFTDTNATTEIPVLTTVSIEEE